MDIRADAGLVQSTFSSRAPLGVDTGQIVRALFIIVLVSLAVPASAVRAVASATIVVPVVVASVQLGLVVSVTTVSTGNYAAVTVAFN
jgi:hypothetical protein